MESTGNSILRCILDVAVQCKDCKVVTVELKQILNFILSGQTSKEIGKEVAGNLIGLNWSTRNF